MSARHSLLAALNRKPVTGRAFLAGPAALWLLLFFLMPLAIMLAWSVMPHGEPGRYVPGFTLEHYGRFLDPLYLRVLWRTIWLSLQTTATCLVLGFPTAWAITRSGRYKTLLLFLAVLPFWTSALVRTYAMMFLLRDGGLINRVLLELGIIATPFRMLYTDGAVLLGLVYGALPFMILPIYASLEKLDGALLEAAEVLGAWPLARFTRVVLPLTMPGIITGSLLVFIPSLGAFVVPDLLGGARHLMVGSLVQNQFGPARNWAFGSAAGFMVMAVVLLALLGWVGGSVGLWGRNKQHLPLASRLSPGP